MPEVRRAAELTCRQRPDPEPERSGVRVPGLRAQALQGQGRRWRVNSVSSRRACWLMPTRYAPYARSVIPKVGDSSGGIIEPETGGAVTLDEPEAARLVNSLQAAVDAQLAVDGLGVGSDGAGGDEQLIGYLGA